MRKNENQINILKPFLEELKISFEVNILIVKIFRFITNGTKVR